MTIKQWLDEAKVTLINTDTPSIDSMVLLCDALDKNSAWVLAHWGEEVDPGTSKKLDVLLSRRQKQEPLAYIRGKQEFYGRDFYVDKRVLVPRPESETMVELAKKLCNKDTRIIQVADVGCGSGALGISLALETPRINLSMYDISEEALAVARRNATSHKIAAQYYCGNLLEPSQNRYDLLLCNLPYVPDDYEINEPARHEPAIAIFAGIDGLELYRTLFEQLSSGEYGTPMVLTESLIFQHEELQQIADTYGYTLVESQDLIQVFSRS